MWNIPSLLSLPGLLCPRVVAPDGVLAMDLRVMAIKGYSTFSKAPALLDSHHQIV